MGSQEAAVVIIHKDLEWEIFIPSVYASTYDRYIPVRNLRINKGGPLAVTEYLQYRNAARNKNKSCIPSDNLIVRQCILLQPDIHPCVEGMWVALISNVYAHNSTSQL